MFTNICHQVLPQFVTVGVVSMTIAGIIKGSDSHYTVTCDMDTLEDNFITIAGTEVYSNLVITFLT